MAKNPKSTKSKSMAGGTSSGGGPAAGKGINLEKLREKNVPLAKILEIFAMGKTSRDQPSEIASDIAIALEARNPHSALYEALTQYEQQLNQDRETKILEDLQGS
ncbi:MAG TPA: hypothetical protein VF735_03760 [Pyrinomonadaceae bacterium]|jgi:hypothetical protein